MWKIADETWIEIAMSGFLLWNSMVDIKRKVVSIRSIWISLVVAFVYSIWFVLNQGSYSFVVEVLLGSIVGIILCVLSLFSRGAIGMGDGILFVVLGIYVGLYKIIMTVLWAIFIAFFWALILVSMRKRNRKESFPFVPFVTVGYFIACVV